jgi:hypothetical protein
MSWYRKVDTRFWADEKVRQLSDDGKLAFLFVLTHPTLTAVGAMRATVPGLAAELGWSERRFRKALEPAVCLGMVELDEAAAFIAFPNFLRFNEPQGPNSVKAWIDALDLIPECAGKVRLVARCRVYLDGKSDTFRAAIGDAVLNAFAMPSGIQEQEQEQERVLRTRDGGRTHQGEEEVLGQESSSLLDTPGPTPQPPAPVSRTSRARDNGHAPLPTKALLAAYDRLFTEKFGSKPVVTRKDAMVAAMLLKAYTLDKIEPLLRGYFETGTKWGRENSAYTLPAFRSQLSKLLVMQQRGEL